MPDALPTKTEEIALFLYAISCGARASTCADVRLQDIVHVEWDEELQKWAVTIFNYNFILLNFCIFHLYLLKLYLK